MLDQTYYDKADEIIASHGAEQASLIPIIQDIQTEYRYLPPELLSYVAGKLGINEAKAYSVATFYENFSFEPKENTSSRYVMEQPVMCVNRFRSWSVSTANWAFPAKKQQQMICCLLWKRFPVSGPAGWRRCLQ